jgi:secretion/DNA translocation related CpaE-like protein
VPTTSLLLVADDPLLRSEVARLAAAAGVGLETADTGDALPAWTSSPAVLVGADALPRLLELGPTRRDEVWVASAGPAGEATLRGALAVGAGAVVELPEQSGHLASWLGELGDRETGAGRGPVLGVTGAAGGVGATVLALAVAEVAAHDGTALLVDLDPWGLPVGALAGVAGDAVDRTDDTEGATTWSDLAALEGRVGGRALRESLPSRGGLRVLSRPTARGTVPAPPPSARVVHEVVTAGSRGHDLDVLDVARGAGAAEVLGRCDAVVVVAAPTLSGAAGAVRVAGLVPPGVEAGLVVRTGRGAWPDDLARLTGLPLWARLRTQRGLDEHLAAGLGAVRSRRSPCARAAVDVLAAIGSRR